MADVSDKRSQPIAAFVHVEKTAGTTLIHILRSNFFFRYMDVRPVFPASARLFERADLAAMQRILPGLRCIGGHLVVPYSTLGSLGSAIKFFSVMRDPVMRYLSQYQHWVEKKQLDMDFETFVSNSELHNFQTKKYAGVDDLDIAKRVLDESFLLVGIVEAYDEFLVLLNRRLGSGRFNIQYSRKNEAGKKVPVSQLAERYRERIIQNNQNDIALYDHVKSVLLPRYKAEYGPGFDADVARFREINSEYSGVGWRGYLDYVLRKLYIEPVTGAMRSYHGRPCAGSY